MRYSRRDWTSKIKLSRRTRVLIQGEITRRSAKIDQKVHLYPMGPQGFRGYDANSSMWSYNTQLVMGNGFYNWFSCLCKWDKDK